MATGTSTLFRPRTWIILGAAGCFVAPTILTNLPGSPAGFSLSGPVAVAQESTSGPQDLLGDDEDLLGGDDDLLSDPIAPAADEAPAAEDAQAAVDKAHAELFLSDRFPSARTCQTCHPQHFEEWSVSAHAYAQLSPIFNAFQGTVVFLSNGTNGDFCIRCHTPVGMNLGEPEFMSNIDRHPTSREGVTCIVCHRVNTAYGRLSGRLAIEEGDLFQTVYGPTGGEELQRVIASPEEYTVNTDPDKPGRDIHTGAEKFFAITTPGFCGSCHDVTLVNGFRLEEAFSAYKMSPAARDGVTCQDCHMGSEQGKNSGYDTGPAAIIGGKPTKDRKVTNHFFAGPDYPIIHPGIFPHRAGAVKEESEKDDPTAEGMATIREWLAFDHEAGWGTDEFEDNVPEGYVFPERWASVDDRYDAREQVLEPNFKLLKWGEEQRYEVLRNGYKLGDIVETRADSRRGLVFKVPVRNGTNGHDVPTGFDAERLVFLHVTVKDRYGKVVMESGDLDPNGDVRDLHSIYVHNGDLPLDEQLFSLQSRFVVRNLRGGEREQVLAVNYTLDPLPFLRPETRATSIYGRPRGARKHRQTIPPDGERMPTYRVAARDLTGHGPYTAHVEMIAAMVPIHLLDAIGLVGFDYNMTPRELADGLRDGHMVLWEREHVFDVDTDGHETTAGR